MEEWKEYKLGDCVEAVIDNRGKSAPTKPLGEFPLLEINSIGGYYPNYSVIRKYVDKVTYYTWFRSGHPICGDILIPTVGTIGIISIMDNHKACIAQNLIALRTKKEISNIFIYYFLKSPIVKKQLINLDIGGVQPSIKVPHLLNLSISLPEKDIQHKIASILSSLDDKIEVNRRINENLEQQAQALFKSWFVDFEPFKDQPFVESELGMIPQGWRVGTLGEIIKEIESGSRPKGGAETDGIPSIGAEKIERFGVYDYSGEKFINNDFYTNMKRGHVEDGDVLLYKDGAYTGKSSMALDGFPYCECAVNEHVFLLRTESSKSQFFLYYLISYPEIKTMIHTLASSKAAQPGLNQKELLGLDIIIPDEDTVKLFNNLVSPSMHQIATNSKQSRRLAELRDTLLPRLMSGELKVNDIEL